MRHKLGSLLLMLSGIAVHADIYDGHQALTGNYSVPTSMELQPFASYPLPKVCWFSASDKVVLGYPLPEELTGRNDNVITLSGIAPAEGPFRLKGDHGTAQCIRSRDLGVSCTVSYGPLNYDDAQREKHLTESFSNSIELTARMEVARSFEGNPLGVITFEDKPSEIPASELPKWGAL